MYCITTTIGQQMTKINKRFVHYVFVAVTMY